MATAYPVWGAARPGCFQVTPLSQLVPSCRDTCSALITLLQYNWLRELGGGGATSGLGGPASCANPD